MKPLAALKLHHFGLAARQPELAVAFLSAQGFHCGTPIIDPLQDVVLRWCERPDHTPVEIVTPNSSDGPLKNVLALASTSFYHLCYEIDWSTDESLEKMRVAGLRVVTLRAALPAVLFGGRHVSFHMVQGFGLIELLESRARERSASA